MGINLRQASAPHTTNGKPRLQIDPPEGVRLDVVSPNWCDSTTWYEKAIEVLAETLTDSGDGLTFNSSSSNWIDTTHGKLTGENDLDVKYKPVVKVASVEKTPDTPFGAGGEGDYAINYAAGTITFHNAPSSAPVVDYWKAAGSEWTIKPAAGRILRITEVEVQFSENIDLKDSVIFQAYGLVDVFAPQLLDTADPAGPYPSGTLIPLGVPTIYKTIRDYINESSLAYPAIPALGGSSRGTSQPVRIFQWPYKERGTTDLKSSAGMEIRIKLENDQVFGGEMAVATFYGLSEAEA